MKIRERVKAKMQKWLEVRPASDRGNIVIREPYSFEADVIGYGIEGTRTN